VPCLAATMLKNKDESAAEPLNKEFHAAMAALERSVKYTGT